MTCKEYLANMYTNEENSKILFNLGLKGYHAYIWAYQYEKFRYAENKRKPMVLVPTRSWSSPDDTIYPAYTILELLDVLKSLYSDIEPEYSKVVFYRAIDDYVTGKDFNDRLRKELWQFRINKGA
jgi:hypothetical protein